jgi:hypothetical protein
MLHLMNNSLSRINELIIMIQSFHKYLFALLNSVSYINDFLFCFLKNNFILLCSFIIVLKDLSHLFYPFFYESLKIQFQKLSHFLHFLDGTWALSVENFQHRTSKIWLSLSYLNTSWRLSRKYATNWSSYCFL